MITPLSLRGWGIAALLFMMWTITQHQASKNAIYILVMVFLAYFYLEKERGGKHQSRKPLIQTERKYREIFEYFFRINLHGIRDGRVTFLKELGQRFWRRISICLLSLLFFAPIHALAAQRIVRVGFYENAPKIFTSESGQPSGIFVDIIENIAHSEGWQLRYVHGTWTEGLDHLARGKIDIMPDVAFTVARKTQYSFHKTPVLSSWDQVYVAKNRGIQSILDLNGKRAAVLEGSIQQKAFTELAEEYNLKVIIIPLPDYKTAFEMVAKGKADAVITNHFYGSMHFREYGLQNTAILLNPCSYFFATNKGYNLDLLEAIDTHLLALKNDPQSAYYQSMNRWITEKVPFTIPTWLKVLGLVVGGILLLSIVGSVILKRQVNARTRALTEQNEQMVSINKSLHDSELKHRTLFETANSAIIIMHDGRIIDCNARTLELFGCSREQILGAQPFELSPPTQPDGRRSDESAFEKINLALGGKPQLFEWEHCRCDRTPFTAEVSLNCMELSGKMFLQAMIRDVSERKQAERDRIAREAAEETSRAKSAFVANMSHEIRTPLNAILGFAQILERDPSLTPKQADQVQTISRSGEHLLQLINDILDMSKIEAGRTTINKTAFCLYDLLDDLEIMFRSRANSKGLYLTVERDESVPRCVTADEGKLRQVLINLMGNAIKFTETGGVAVRVHAEVIEENAVEGKVSLRLWIEVEDTGSGIPDEDIDRIFEAFHQAETGVKAGGTGLGLAISREFVEMMGGKFTVKSQLGKGSCFRFDIMLEQAEDIADRKKLTSRRVTGLEPGTRAFRVLVVDDVPTNRIMLCDLLQPVGFEVAEASNGVEALKVFEEWSPHAILMDLRMPVMDGYEAIRRLRIMETARATAIIAVTASAFDDYKEQVMAIGADAYMRKPFRPEELYEALGKCLNLHYIFADEMVNTPSRSETTTQMPAMKTELPLELVQAMIQAVTDGDMTRLSELITQVELVDNAVARSMQAWADRYDYERIEEWLRKVEKGYE